MLTHVTTPTSIQVTHEPATQSTDHGAATVPADDEDLDYNDQHGTTLPGSDTAAQYEDMTYDYYTTPTPCTAHMVDCVGFWGINTTFEPE